MKQIAVILLAVLLSACGTKGVVNLAPPSHTVLEVDKLVAYDCGIAPDVDKFTALVVLWEYGVNEDGKVGFFLLPVFYENLGINTADWILGTGQLKIQRNFYSDCIDRSKEEVEGLSIEPDADPPPEP